MLPTGSAARRSDGTPACDTQATALAPQGTSNSTAARGLSGSLSLPTAHSLGAGPRGSRGCQYSGWHLPPPSGRHAPHEHHSVQTTGTRTSAQKPRLVSAEILGLWRARTADKAGPPSAPPAGRGRADMAALTTAVAAAAAGQQQVKAAPALPAALPAGPGAALCRPFRGSSPVQGVGIDDGTCRRQWGFAGLASKW